MDQDYFETFSGEKNRLMTIIFELNINECELSDIFSVQVSQEFLRDLIKIFFTTHIPIRKCKKKTTANLHVLKIPNTLSVLKEGCNCYNITDVSRIGPTALISRNYLQNTSI